MKLRKPHNLLVCLFFLLTTMGTEAVAVHVQEAAFVSNPSQSAPQTTNPTKAITKVKPKQIVKVRPPERLYPQMSSMDAYGPPCVLPTSRPRGWELGVEALFARTRGKVRFMGSNYGWAGTNYRDLDLNSDIGVPEHQWIGSLSAKYGFKPRWSVRYSVMPSVVETSVNPSTTFSFGYMFNAFGLNTKVKWERLYQRMGLAYDPVRTLTTRVSVFGDYVRLNERLRVFQPGCCSSTFDNDLNMAMAGLEIERCLKTSRLCNTLSVECKAGFAFGGDAVGSDLATALKYSIPLNNGRWGFVKGGYRYISFKKKYSDLKIMETAMDGGFVEAGFIF